MNDLAALIPVAALLLVGHEWSAEETSFVLTLWSHASLPGVRFFVDIDLGCQMLNVLSEFNHS